MFQFSSDLPDHNPALPYYVMEEGAQFKSFSRKAVASRHSINRCIKITDKFFMLYLWHLLPESPGTCIGSVGLHISGLFVYGAK